MFLKRKIRISTSKRLHKRGRGHPDMTFLAFPFTEVEARKKGNNAGISFVIEERVGESGFGLDEKSSGTDDWNNLSWEDFECDHGDYAEKLSDAWAEKDLWNNGTSAFRPKVTLQRPYRVFIHADQQLPAKE
jgi:hypothetical protein